MGSSFQLVFAPIDEHFPDDAPLISSGFRVIPLDMKTVKHCQRLYFFLSIFPLRQLLGFPFYYSKTHISAIDILYEGIVIFFRKNFPSVLANCNLLPSLVFQIYESFCLLKFSFHCSS